MKYQIRGHGRYIVLVHGFGVTTQVWKKLSPMLEKHFSVVTVSLSGMGERQGVFTHESIMNKWIMELEKTRQRLYIETWDMVGYSGGSRVIEAYNAIYPKMVGKVVLICPAYFVGLRSFLLDFAIRVDKQWPTVGRWILSGWRLPMLVRVLGFNGKWVKEARIWAEEIGRSNIEALRGMLYWVSYNSRRRFEIDKPTLYIVSTDDWALGNVPLFGQHVVKVSGGHSAPVIDHQVSLTIIPFLRAGSI